MRDHIKKLWGKIKLTVIILLSVLIGISWTISYLKYAELKKEESQTWNLYLQIKANEEPVKTESHEQTDTEDKGGKTSLLDTSAPSGEIQNLIYEYFKTEYRTSLAIFTAESGLRADAQGFNCRYGGVSQACRAGDEGRAVSTDCGIAQINVQGKTCPPELFNPRHNLEVARAKYEQSNWKPWSAFKNKSYLTYLK
jgi:hypothetical protein